MGDQLVVLDGRERVVEVVQQFLPPQVLERPAERTRSKASGSRESLNHKRR